MTEYWVWNWISIIITAWVLAWTPWVIMWRINSWEYWLLAWLILENLAYKRQPKKRIHWESKVSKLKLKYFLNSHRSFKLKNNKKSHHNNRKNKLIESVAITAKRKSDCLAFNVNADSFIATLTDCLKNILVDSTITRWQMTD